MGSPVGIDFKVETTVGAVVGHFVGCVCALEGDLVGAAIGGEVGAAIGGEVGLDDGGV